MKIGICLALAAVVLLGGGLGARAEFDLDAVKRSSSQDVRFESSGMTLVGPKAANASTVASRATSTQAATVYGGFELATSAVVYILVRGNSLGSLGVTSNYLDAPRLRLYNSQGQDLITDGSGRPGFNGCISTNTTTDLPVINYYQNVRGQPANSRDACIAVTASAGAYTFSVTPSVAGVTSTGTTSAPGSGEILFEVTLGPSGAAPPADNNQTRTERLVGGTWTFVYTILSTFSDSYSFTSVTPSTSTPGDYLAVGTDRFGDLVIGGYVSSTGQWAVLDQGILIDAFFIFTFTDNNHVSGCYHQVSPSGSTNLGACRSMAGSRFPLKSAAAPTDPDHETRAAMEGVSLPPETDPDVLATYLEMRKLSKSLSMTSKTVPRPSVDNQAGSEVIRDGALVPRGTQKAASARTVASRATATPSATVYGGFELTNTATVYILARGNSLGSLGVTQSYLDLPRLRLFDSAGRDLAFDNSGAAGFNRCLTTGTASAPVRDYYSRIRGAPAHDSDACTSRTLSPGAYTFSVTPSTAANSVNTSAPGAGEILFEVTLGP